MGEHELQEALRSKAQEQIREIWRAAEESVSARRAEVAAEAAALRAEAERTATARAVEIRRQVLAEDEAAVRRQQLAAETELGARLRELALALLPGLAGTRRAGCWAKLTAELPAAEWQRIRVHPDDRPFAQRSFPAAEVVAEETLGGGLVVETADGRVVVDNSLAGRLERAWPELLTRLFAALNEEVGKDAAGTTATG